MIEYYVYKHYKVFSKIRKIFSKIFTSFGHNKKVIRLQDFIGLTL